MLARDYTGWVNLGYMDHYENHPNPQQSDQSDRGQELSEPRPKLTAFSIDTDTIPDDVDPDLAQQRNASILAWRKGEISAKEALERMLTLYWRTSDFADDATRHYLMDVATSFQIEAEDELSFDDSDEIYMAMAEKFA